MHIVHLTQHYWPYDRGGSGLSVRTLAEGLAAQGQRVTVLAQARGGRDELRQRNGVEVRHLALTGAASRPRGGFVDRALGQVVPDLHPAFPRRLRGVLAELGADLMHTHIVSFCSTRVWQVARGLGLPVAHTLRDYYLLCPRGTMLRGTSSCGTPCLECSAMASLRRRRAVGVSAAVGISRSILQRHLQAGFFADAQHRRVIPNGVELPVQARREGPATGGPLRVGFLGRLHPSKGVEVLLKAVEQVPRAALQVSVAGAGKPDYEAQLRPQAQALGVELLGQVEPAEYLAGLDVLVVPSRFEEPFGRVVVEAFLHGVPVICSRRGGAQDLVREGHTGWLFDPDLPQELAALLRRLAAEGIPDSQRRACRVEARSYSGERAVEAHRQLYAELLPAAEPAPALPSLGGWPARARA